MLSMAHKTGRLVTVLLTAVVGGGLGAPRVAWPLPQTQDLKGEVVSEKSEAIPGAVCTLNGPALPDQGVTVTAGEKGEFQFPGLVPGTYGLLCAAAGHEAVAQKSLELTEAAAPPFVQVVLPDTIVVREKVEVRGQAPTMSQQSSAPPTIVTSQQLRTLPLTQQKFKAALPLVPGVIRTPDGKINIKGSVETQGMLLVDSADTVDPVTGSFSIEIPIDAVESMEVYKSTYGAEYGRFSGGLTSIQTKPPSSQWNFEVNDFVPAVRIKSGHIVGIADNKPRVSFTGPLWANRVNFSEAITYELLKQPVRGLSWPRNETKTEGVNSFTNFQVFFSPRHLMTANLNLFPMRRQFADINSLIPQSASTDYGQRGFSVGFLDRYLLASGGILTTLVRATNFSSYARGQGVDDMIITPNGRDGHFFNSWTRSSYEQEVLQSFQFARKQWLGRHDMKIGGDFVHRSYNGTSISHPLQIQRADGSPAERIDFVGPGKLSAGDTEVAVYLQDHWAFSDRLAMDLGLRYSGQTIGESAAIAPRVGMVYSPGESGKTIIRSGVGVFFDRVPLLAGDFTHNPTRVVTFFDGDGIPTAPPLAFRNAYVKVDHKGRRVIPPGRDLSNTPYNATWNLELDREIHPRMVVRLSYLSSRTLDIFIMDPVVAPGIDPILLLTNTGRSRYQEFESTLRVRPSANTDWNISYVRSLARGDLNTLTQVYVPFEQPVIRPNFFGDLPSNVPHRLITWGRFKIPREIIVSPLIDLHSGFPYSATDVFQDYVGEPNSRRFPTFFSLDLQLSKDLHLPLIPWLKKHKLRGAFRIFNLTNHANPRDVYANIASPFFGRFVGFQHRFYDASLDIVY